MNSQRSNRAGEQSDGAVRAVVARVARIPSLRAKYGEFVDQTDLDLTRLPVLTKDELNAAMADVYEYSRRSPQGAYLYGSGGTTSAPKLSLIPSTMFVPDILRHWRPLETADVLVNMYKPGRLWSSHNFYNAVAEHSGATVIPLGAPDAAELPQWLEFLDSLGATALGATPSQVAHLLEFCEKAGYRPPRFRKLLWVGEPYGRRAAELVHRFLPELELHGLYGCTETWVIGHNGPGCPSDTFHVLPYQHVEIQDEYVLVTNTHPATINPVLRYRVGDRGRLVHCPCGRDDTALLVLGRDDPQLKFLNILVTPDEIAAVALEVPGVRQVQVALIDHGTPDERLELRVVCSPAVVSDELADRVRTEVLARVYRLGWAVASAPNAFAVTLVDQLAVNPRTFKTPLLVREDSA
jgi:phenylacetate-coenzyme A ligase PaaK-like adenylate-forming protein